MWSEIIGSELGISEVYLSILLLLVKGLTDSYTIWITIRENRQDREIASKRKCVFFNDFSTVLVVISYHITVNIRHVTSLLCVY